MDLTKRKQQIIYQMNSIRKYMKDGDFDNSLKKEWENLNVELEKINMEIESKN